jgi:Fe-S cluster assembly protein SufD
VSAAIPLTAGIGVPGPEPTRPARLHALAALGAAGWPTRRRESWRYTDLEPLAAAKFALVPEALDRDTVAAARRVLGDASLGDPARQLVLLDGERVEGLGASSVADVEVTSPEAHWDEFVAAFAKPIGAAEYPLAALNTAFSRGGLWIRVRAGVVVRAPIHLVLVGSARDRIAAQPRVVLELEPGAQATFVQHFVDCTSDSQGWSNSVTQVKQGAGSRLVFQRLQRHASGVAHTSLLSAELATSAELAAGYFDLGGRLVRNDIAIALHGAHARADLFGLLLAGKDQHVDDHTVIRHAAGETVSSESFRGIIGDRGRGVFNGKVVVERGCQRIDARQSNDNLLLGEHAEIDTKPELEIYANDVKCSHGSTVGELDAEQLFYLRARGLSDLEARSLLTTAFAATIVEQIADADLRASTLAHVTARLGEFAVTDVRGRATQGAVAETEL